MATGYKCSHCDGWDTSEPVDGTHQCEHCEEFYQEEGTSICEVTMSTAQDLLARCYKIKNLFDNGKLTGEEAVGDMFIAVGEYAATEEYMEEDKS